MMVLMVLVALATSASAKSVGPLAIEHNTAYGYLKKIGICQAERIQKAEDAYLSEVRIVGGLPANQGQYPYQAGLISDIIGITSRGVCGGSLISTNRVLTAAHCWYDGQNQAWRLTVVLGSTFLFSGGIRLETSAVALHPNWFPLLIRNDIAVVYLPNHVPTSATIAPIDIPTTAEASETFEGRRAVASGFGLTSTGGSITTSQQLSHVSLNVISNRRCNIAFPMVIQQSHICTSGIGGVGVCAGDSGGPLALYHNDKNILIGVASFGIVFGCDIGYPSAYVRVSSYTEFINQHI